MIQGNFLTPEQRRDLTILVRRPKVEHRVARRANALVMLDRGKSCEEVAEFLLLDDDTVRTWRREFELAGVERDLGLQRRWLCGTGHLISGK